MNSAISKIIIILIFVLAGVLFFHNLTSINADIGRHIKLGEIIWQTKSVPNSNLFSFIAPDHPFVNHHWLSEVVFYGTYSLGSDWLSGLKAVMILKIIVLLATYFLLFLIVAKRHNIFAVALAFLVSIFVFSVRTEPRPEIFSYLIFAAYLLIIYRAKELTTSQVGHVDNRQSSPRVGDRVPHEWVIPHSRNAPLRELTMSGLWLLPVLQLFWVNLHIYFILGPIIFLFFLIDRGFCFGGLRFWNWNLFRVSSLEFRVFVTILLANLANPNFIKGALYPFMVLNEYGYSVAENSSLFFLAKYFGQWALQDKLFLASLFVLAGSFVIYFWQKNTMNDRLPHDRLRKSFMWITLKTRVFDLLLIATTIVLSFKMQRNIPLFALSLWPVLSENLSGVFEPAKPTRFQPRKNIPVTYCLLLIVILVISIFTVTSGRFYRFLDSSKMFGLGVSSAAQDGTDFIKANNIQGPVFNNFDIGSYLVWQLEGSGPFLQDKKGPDPSRVFVDGRPEAYPVEFFENIYKPMQRDEKVWNEMSEKYNINYVFFAHTDMTEWADEFLIRIAKDPEWPMVFLNDAVVVFLKDAPGNRPIIGRYKITDDNLDKNIAQVLDKLDINDNNAFVNFGNTLYRFRYLAGAAEVYEELIENQPDNPYGYQGAGYAYASMNDPATQEKAAKNLEKAIGLGFKTFNNYFTLGIIKANLGNYFAAEENIAKALKIKPDNQNAKQALETIKKRLFIIN